MFDADFASNLRLVEIRTPDEEWSADPDCVTALLFCSAAMLWKLSLQWEWQNTDPHKSV